MSPKRRKRKKRAKMMNTSRKHQYPLPRVAAKREPSMSS